MVIYVLSPLVDYWLSGWTKGITMLINKEVMTMMIVTPEFGYV